MAAIDVTEPQSSDPEREIPVRRISFEESIEGLDKDFTADGEVIMAHLMASLSGVFPDGEQIFIDSVRHFRDQVTDPDLLRQVNGFIGQEVTHGREHRRLNARLDQLGYRSKLVERTMQTDTVITPGMQRIVWLASRVGPLKDLLTRIEAERETGGPDPMFMLALTAALEHFTATMAKTFLTEPDLQTIISDDAFLRFWVWHAIEESEHRAVAFDVYKAVGGDEETRLRAMRVATVVLMFIGGYHTVAGVLRDRRSYRRFGLLTSITRLPSNPFLSKRFRRELEDYNRPDFHPLQQDTSGMEGAWLEWLEWLEQGGPRPVIAV